MFLNPPRICFQGTKYEIYHEHVAYLHSIFRASDRVRQKMKNSAAFSREILRQERSIMRQIMRQIMRFFKADLTLFFEVSEEETHFFAVQMQRAIRA